VVKPSRGLDRLPPEILIDRSNPGGGIRIGLRNATAPARSVAPDTFTPPRYPAVAEYPVASPYDVVGGRFAEPQAIYGASQDARGTDVIRELEYVVVDVETTGGAPSRGHRMTEFGAVRMRGDGTIIDEYESLVNPMRHIPAFITDLTSITPQMAYNAPLFGEIAENVRAILDGAVFVAHNAPFDRRFVGMELGRVGVPMFNRTLCTVRLARKTVTEVQARSLDSLQYFFGIENYARHRAMGDARATALIFRKLLDRLDEHEVTRWNELESFLRRRPKKRKKRVASPQPVEDTVSI
jgi:DNA polymerase-3 subunit epsilon